jgi:DNA-binding CsgD family transcriptional regulator
MRGMARRPTSARLVGREEELTDLLGAVASVDPDRPVVLVAGEAGIGKTRLVNELVRRVDGNRAANSSAPWSVARGSCLRLAEGELPFAPILEILDAIPEKALVGKLRAKLAGAGDARAVGSAEARAMRFVEIRDVLVAASAGSPFLVVIDDLHWADQSTLDLVLFLARRLRGHSVVLLGAYRSDELHRRHPLRPVVAELSRGYVRERIELRPLPPQAVAEQVRLLRDSIEDDVIAEVVARADGNPFYVEELIALDSNRSPLPVSVRDVLLARLAALDAATLRVLGACAVVGRDVDPRLLQQVVDLDPATMAACIGTAVEHSILVPTPEGGYRFRHALLEEAVHDDLLPADRVELHRRVAEALRQLAAVPGGDAPPPGELARHFDLSGDWPAAVDAYLDAAATAFRALAWAEGVAAYERAAELIATAPLGSRDATAIRLRELVIPAALAMGWSGSPARSITLLREWVERTEALGDHVAAASLWVTLSQVLNEVGDEPGSREAGAAAVRLYEPTASTALGITLLIDLAAGRWIANRQSEAYELSEQAVRGAERLAEPALLFRALLERGAALITLGHLDRGIADVDRARALQAEHGHLDTFGHLTTNIPAALTEVGLLGPALELTQEGLRVGKELGIEQSWEPWILPGLAAHAYVTGRWAEADDPIARTRAYRPGGLAKHYVEMFAALLAAGRGDFDACDAALRAADEAGAGLTGGYEGFRGEARAARAEAAGDAVAWLAEATAANVALEGTDSFVARSRLAVATASAAADLALAMHPTRDRKRIDDARRMAQAAAQLAAAIDGGTAMPRVASVPWTRANAALAAAEAARAEAQDDPAAWPPIADEFREMSMLPRVAYVQFRAAAAAFAAGDRAGGTEPLLDARRLATSIGMSPLLRRIDALARAARVGVAKLPTTEVAPVPRPEPSPWGLSARELEVLALLADGRTNGEIGARLFISTKTASVHVTHILDKLGVSTRTEAALLASRAGLLDGQLQRTE